MDVLAILDVTVNELFTVHGVRRDGGLRPAPSLGRARTPYSSMTAVRTPQYAKHYWHVGGSTYNLDLTNNNRTRDPCRIAFGGECPTSNTAPPAERWPRADGGGALLYSGAFGQLSNCHVVLNFARWLAELLGKRAAVPLCAEGNGCFWGEYSREAQRPPARWANLSEVWDPESFAGCRAFPLTVMPSMATELRETRATCLALSAEHCANEIAVDPRLSGKLILGGFSRSTLPTLAAASLRTMGECGGAGQCDWAALPVSERCRQLVASGGCEACSASRGSSRSATRACESTPCPRACAAHVNPGVPRGDVYVANLHSMALSLGDTWRLCDPPRLGERARRLAAALRATLPPKFICMHWRLGDFLRLPGYKNYASLLLNTTEIARLVRMAAAGIGASAVLVLTNGAAQLTAALTKRLRQGAVSATVARCTDTPADAEKAVCAGADALLLSAKSTFSRHILKLAPPGTPYAFLGYCARDTSWQECASRQAQLQNARKSVG